ncbi:MAG: hypothetical protein LUF33_06530, partial [Clostridiales bacterium]|nr:hypothetical protein [Clostridiales bacterium]
MGYGTAALLVVILVILIAAAVAVYVIVEKVKSASRMMFGTESFFEGINNQKAEMSETPRSLHAMTSVYLPQILRDFPEFDYELYKNKAQSLLRSYFTAVETKRTSALKEECSLTLKNRVQGIIDDLNSAGVTRVFNRAVIHDTQIARYIKNGATVTVLFEISTGYISYGEDENGNTVFGDRNIKQQTVYEVGLVYVQDADKVDT